MHIVRNWQDQLRDHLVQVHGEEQGIRLANRFGKALPAGYVESTSPEQAATDIGVAAALSGDRTCIARSTTPPTAACASS